MRAGSRIRAAAAALLAVFLAACMDVPRHHAQTALRCADLGVPVPDVSTVLHTTRPFLENDSVLEEKARAIFLPRWSRLAALEGLVRADGSLARACMYLSSGDLRFDRAALAVAGEARFGFAAYPAGPRAGWTVFSVFTRVENPPIREGRFRSIANPGTIAETMTGEGMDLQAAILEHLLSRSSWSYIRASNTALCVGVGPQLPVLDPPRALLARLDSTPLPVYPASACEVDYRYSSRAGARKSALVLHETGEPAMALWVDLAEERGVDTTWVRSGALWSYMNGTDWDCLVTRRDGVWTLVKCEMTATT